MMAKKPRYYVAQDGDAWLVCDRNKYKMHNDVVSRHRTREVARAAALLLNDSERDLHTDGQFGQQGETI